MNDQDQNLYGIDLQQFFNELHLDHLDPAKQEEYFKTFSKILEGRLFLRFMDLITEEEEKSLEGKSQEEVMKYLGDKGIDIGDIAIEEASKFREELIGNMAYMKGMVDEMQKEATNGNDQEEVQDAA
jgi:hypothetical protein